MITAICVLTFIFVAAHTAAANAPRKHRYSSFAAETLKARLTVQPKLNSASGKHSPRFLVAQILNRGLAGSPMSNTGFALERAGWHWRISPYLIAGIAATESSLGRAACSNNRFNAYGLASCGSGWSVPAFRSWAESYEFMGRFISSRWPTARSPYDLVGYAACSSCWAAHVAGFMRSLFGVQPEVRYGAA